MSNTKDLRVAVVHDWFLNIRGAERVVECILELYPQADVYTLFYDSKAVSKYLPILENHKVYTSWLNKIPFIKKFYKYTYFLWPMSVEIFDLREYDLVISSSACASKGVITGVDTPHISYMHTPMRYAWDQTFDYFNPDNFSWWKRIFISLFIHYIRIWDVTSTDRVDHIIANSEFVGRRIKKYYRRDADSIVYPPVSIANADYTKKKLDYYVAIAPYEANKGGRLIVEAAIKQGFKLKIIGDGSLKKELEKKAKGYDKIEFLGYISEKEKWEYLAKAKAFLFCGVEDFGIVVLEALACGTPVIAYKKGGALSTIKDGVNGVFFEKSDSKSLIASVKRFEKLFEKGTFSPKSLNNYSQGFSKEVFKKRVSDIVSKVLNN